MSAGYVAPTLGANSFSCPHCGARAHQTWFGVYTRRYGQDEKPGFPLPDALDRIRREVADPTMRENLINYYERLISKLPFIDQATEIWSKEELKNCSVSQCFSCNESSIWIGDRILYPLSEFDLAPNEDLTPEIKLDFKEAARIVDISPRGAAALLRLCIQKLCIHVGEAGKRIDDDIASLVRKGLDPRIQQALDIVRVIGNEAVHPGQIDLRDDRAAAAQLFDLVNIIADALISQPKRIGELYSKLPPGKLEAIERRDAQKQITKQPGT